MPAILRHAGSPPPRQGSPQLPLRTAPFFGSPPRRRDHAAALTSIRSLSGSPPVGRDHVVSTTLRRHTFGSPPLRQGLRRRAPGDPASRRFTPASARTTICRFTPGAGLAVHLRVGRDHTTDWFHPEWQAGSPRVSGKHTFSVLLPTPPVGSPLHRRGPPHDLVVTVSHWRFTPASAGTPSS